MALTVQRGDIVALRKRKVFHHQLGVVVRTEGQWIYVNYGDAMPMSSYWTTGQSANREKAELGWHIIPYEGSISKILHAGLTTGPVGRVKLTRMLKTARELRATIMGELVNG